jgi:sulfonate transport system permease protein
MERAKNVLDRVGFVALYAWLPTGLLLMWWFLAPRRSIYFPALWTIIDFIRQQWIWGFTNADLRPSIEHFALGYVIALAAGILIGLGMYSIPVFYRLSLPIVTFFRGLPSVALIPVLLLLLGIGGVFKIGIIALGATQVVLLNTINGLRSIDTVQLETARSYGFSRWHTVTKVWLPSASPQIVAGARTGLQAAILLMVASEFIASSDGVGYVITTSQQSFNGPGMWSGMVVLGLLGVVLNLIFIIGEKWVLGWYLGMRAQEAST